MDKRILLIVEGPRDEKALVKRLWDRFDRNTNYDVVTYNTNIHVLIRELFRYGIDDDVDVVRYLKSSDIPEERRIGRDESFSDVYLIFDFDSQDPLFDSDMLKDVLHFFDDSTYRGKLFINYPMMQSYRHITGPDDEGFRERTVRADIGRGYNSLVDGEAWNRLKQTNSLDRGMLRFIIERHLMKMNWMVNGDYRIPTMEEYEKITQRDVLERQLEKMRGDGTVYVLNTSVFLVVDYNPSWFLDREPLKEESDR